MRNQPAELPPSSAHMWGECSGWRDAQVGLDNPETDASRLGDAGHWVASQCISRNTDPLEYVEETAPNGVVVDQDTADAAEVYVQDVRQTMAEYPGGGLFVEYPVSIPLGERGTYGTLDCALTVPSAGKIIVWDYKTGHRKVSARANLQLVNYGVGLYNSLNMSKMLRLEFRVVRPNAYHSGGPIDVWRPEPDEILQLWRKLVAKAIESYDSPTLSPGLWCRDCLARNRCSARREADYSLIDLAEQPYRMDDLDGADLAKEWALLVDGAATIKRRIETLEDELVARIQRGEPGTGLTLENGQGRPKFTIPDEQVVALAKLFEVDASTRKVLTPAQIVKAADPRVRSALSSTVDAVTERKPTGAKLVFAENTRFSKAFQPKEG